MNHDSMMRIYKIFGIKQDIDSLETVVDVKKNRWNVKQSGFLKKKINNSSKRKYLQLMQ